MRLLAALLCFASLHLRAADNSLDNKRIVEFKTANEIFRALDFRDAGNPKFSIWKSVIESQGIFPCRPLVEPPDMPRTFG